MVKLSSPKLESNN